jgi:hypothetical protein
MELRAAYIGGLPLEAAADKAGVAHGTARNWFNSAKKAGDDWNKFQAASLIVAGGGIEQAIGRIIAAGLIRCESLLEQLNKPEVLPGEAVKAMAVLGDTIAKLKAAGKGMMPETDAMAVQLDTLKRYAEFVRVKYPAQAAAMLETLEAFGEVLANGR